MSDVSFKERVRLLGALGSRRGLAQKLVRTTVGSAVIRIVGMGLTFLVGVQLARYLGPRGYGDYGTVMAIVAVLIVPAQLGLPQLLTRELSAFVTTESFGRVKGAMLWFLFAVLVTSLSAMALGWLGVRLWGDHLDKTFSHSFAWGLMSIPFTALTSLCVAALRGFHHVMGAQLGDALIRPLLFAALIWAAAAHIQMDAGAALCLQTIAAVATLVFCAVHLSFVVPKRVRATRSTQHIGPWISSAVPMTGTEVLRVLDGQYAVLLLGFITTLDQVGIFRIAVSASAFIGLPVTVLSIVIMPYVAQFYAAGDQEKLQKIVSGSTLVIFFSVASLTVGLAFFGRTFITHVFGAAFAPATRPLVLMGVAYSINGFFGSAATLLNMCDQERTVARVYFIGPTVGICVTCLTFQWVGISAAAVALIAAETIKGLIMWRVARRTLKVDPSMFGVTSLWAKAKPEQQAQANCGSA